MVKEIAGVGMPQAAEAKAPTGAKPAKDFGEFLAESLEKVDTLQQEADAAVTRAAQGDGDIQEAMVAVEKADVAFKLMMEVRQKILDAYQEIMRMQV